MTAEPTIYGDRTVYPVSAFNKRVAGYIGRLPTVWVEGEVTELKRNPGWASVFLTLKDPSTGACLPVTIARTRFDRLEPLLVDGDRVHAQGRPELYEARGSFAFRAATIERFGLGDHLAALERLKTKLAAEGLFAAERKRRLPRFPRAVGLLTGADAAAKGDIVTAATTRFPAVHLVVHETRVQGQGAAMRIVAGLRRLAAHPEVDVVIVARGGGSFDDLLPFSTESVVRAIAACPVPVVSAVGHEQDTPLCDLAADVRAATPTAAARLVVPDLEALLATLQRSRSSLETGVRRHAERHRQRLDATAGRLRSAPRLLLERRRAALETAGARLRAVSPHATVQRGYAIVRTADGQVLRDASVVSARDAIDVELAAGGLSARVEETRA